MIPNKVRVAGMDYKVTFSDVIEINGNKNFQGSCHYKNTEIKILNEISDDRKEQVFIHELVHAILNETGLDDQDEDMVERFGILLHQVLRDNELKIGK